MRRTLDSRSDIDRGDTSRIETQRVRTRAILLVFALSLLAFSMACHLCIARTQTAQPEVQSLAETLFGDARIALAGELFARADVYFHRGAPHEVEKAFDSDPFQVLHSKVSPHDHAHAAGEFGIREIMPWLDLTTRIDPQNLDGYLVAAFWLAGEAKRPDLALEVLNRAQQNIPFSYDVQLERGRLYLRTGDRAMALQAFDAALRFWERAADSEDPNHLLDKAEALLYRALLREEAGNIADAAADLRDMLAVAPDRTAFRPRLAHLEKGEPAEPVATELLTLFLHQHDEEHSTCPHEEDDEHDHEHHDEHDDH
jgi:tetratricopeptide (TPR) repeat protein